VFTTATLDLVRIVSVALSSTLDTAPVLLVLLHDKLKLVMMRAVSRSTSRRPGGRVRLKEASEDAGCSGGSWVGNSQLVEGRRDAGAEEGASYQKHDTGVGTLRAEARSGEERGCRPG
jgi:hypothetical protein